MEIVGQYPYGWLSVRDVPTARSANGLTPDRINPDWVTPDQATNALSAIRPAGTHSLLSTQNDLLQNGEQRLYADHATQGVRAGAA